MAKNYHGKQNQKTYIWTSLDHSDVQSDLEAVCISDKGAAVNMVRINFSHYYYKKIKIKNNNYNKKNQYL